MDTKNVETLPSAKLAAATPQTKPLLAKDIEIRDRLVYCFNHPWDVIGT
jgi:hypothetical protein